ncbi:MAG: OmpH family outer membrane protein, partial [Armatimonadota bacterium]
MQRKTARIVGAVVALGLAAVCASTALAQEETTDAKIAVVSLSRVQANYGQLRAQEQDLGQWLEGRRAYHDQLTNYVFLPSTDFEEALELMRKPQPLSDEDQARLDELQSISDTNEQRYAELRAKTERTAEEAAEFNALQDMYDASAEALETVQQNIMEELTDRRETALAGLMDTVEDAIGATAEEAGYDLVIDADMVFYGGADITDDVLARLNGDDEQPADAEDDAD